MSTIITQSSRATLDIVRLLLNYQKISFQEMFISLQNVRLDMGQCELDEKQIGQILD